MKYLQKILSQKEVNYSIVQKDAKVRKLSKYVF